VAQIKAAVTLCHQEDEHDGSHLYRAHTLVVMGSGKAKTFPPSDS
jgi:hypothetical protein